MLPRAEAPARRLPYTTADMAERLAKKKAEQDAASFKAFPGGVTKPFNQTKPFAQNREASSPSWLSQVGNMAKSLVLTPAGTALDMIPYVANIPGVKGEGAWGYEPEDIGTFNFFQAGGQALEQSGRRLVGDVTAIPGLGKDSPSYTADQIRKYGVAEGLASAGLDYGNLALTAAPFVKPTGWAIGNAINDAKYAAYLRRTKSPFPDVVPPKPGTFIEAVQGADEVWRVPGATKSPASPATRLAEAQTQRALPPAATRALPPAKIAPIEVETVASSLKSPEYRGQHGAPGKGAGAPLHDMLEDGGIYPKDVYSANAIRFYGVGDDKLDAIAANLIKKYKGQPNAEVTIYRAVPKNISLDDAQIIAGDWVTPIREYAMMHGDGALRGEYQIIEKQVKAKDVYTAGDSWLEWGYDPQSPLSSPATRLAEAQSQRQIITTPSTQLPAEYLALADETPITPAFTTPVEANQYLAGNGSLEQLEKVAPGYLWEAVENNSTASLPSGRFKQIGSGGGWIGMDRYVDQATGKHFGLKMRPGMKQFEAEWHPGPMAEILANDIAINLGFPNMNLRLIRNSDDSISLITDLAQDVYGGTIVDSWQAGLHGEANNWLPSIASRVPIEDRIRMAVLDDLVNNGDRHSGNILYSVNDDGSVRLVPIDHEVTFQGPGGGTPRRFAQTYEFNVSVRQAYLEDSTKLFEDIKTAIAKIQQELKQKTPDLLENFESKLVKTSEQFGIPRSRYIDRPVKQLTDDLTQFLNDTPDQIAQKYWNQIAEGFQF